MVALTDGLRKVLRSVPGFARPLYARPSGGGCISTTLVLHDETGVPTAFLKLNRPECLGMFEAEMEALEDLAAVPETGLRVPHALGCGVAEDQAWLLLEYLSLDSRGGGADAYAALGTGLARLHHACSANGCHGWRRDNTIGATLQRNPWTRDWSLFFRDHRLAFQFELAAARGRVFAEAESLLNAVPALLQGHKPPPSLLHGDLWSGNAAFLSDGTPVVFDPAVYYGDREADLAFSRLFGGFPASFYEAYEREWPLPAECQRRAELYNLYHLLNHFNLFGEPYGWQAEQSLKRLRRR